MIYKANSTISKIYHYAVGLVRRDSGSTSMGFFNALFESVFSFVLMGLIMMLMRSAGLAIRGEFGFYVLSGISLFMLHNKVLSAVMGGKKTNPMLPILGISRGMMIVGTILYEVYMQLMILSILYFLCFIYYAHSPVHDWVGVVICFLLMILWSVSLGTLFLALSPIHEPTVQKIAQIYKRLGIISSGKMIPGNMVAATGKMMGLFMINPIFHLIDQLRGDVFIHYVPHVTNIYYPFYMSVGFFCLAAVIYFAVDKIR